MTAPVPHRFPGQGRRARATLEAARLAIIVAGMHRSGTSAMTRVLSLCGLELPRALMPQNEYNEDGYWESEEFRVRNDALLAEMGSAWDDVLAAQPSRIGRYNRTAVTDLKDAIAREFESERDVVIKDPRISIMLPLWREAVEELSFAPKLVIMVRHPLEVAASLGQRDKFSAAKATLLWLAHLIAVERDSRDLPRVFVSYDDLLRDWRGALGRIERALGLKLPGWHAATEADIDRFLSTGRRHHNFELDALATRTDLPSWISAAYNWALDACSAETDVDPAPLDAIAGPFHEAAAIFAPMLSPQRRAVQVPPPAKPQAAPKAPNRDTVIRLYSATASERYDEGASVQQTVRLTSEPQTVTLTTPVRAAPLTELRIDPADREGRMLLHSLTVRSPDGQTLWEWDRTTTLFSRAKGIDADPAGDDGALLTLLNEDPQAELPVGAALGDTRQVLVELTVSAPTDADLACMRMAKLLSAQLETVTPHVARAAAFAEQAKAVAASAIVAADERMSQLAAFTERRLAALSEEFAANARALSSGYEAHVAELKSELATARAATTRLEEELVTRAAALAQTRADAERARQEAEQNARHADEERRAREAVEIELDGRRREADTFRRVAEERARENHALLTSTSWRITAPLRALRGGPAGILRGVRQFARQVRAAIRKRLTGKSYAALATPELHEQAELLENSSYFDPAWYIAVHPDLRAAKADPVTHYLLHGGFEGRPASLAFDSRFYLAQNPDVAAAGVNPLVHFIVAGRREGRMPAPPRHDGPSPTPWKFAVASAALRVEWLWPRGLARKLRASAAVNAPRQASTPAQTADGSVHAATMGALHAAASARGDEYVPLAPAPIDVASRIRAIAYYLPQFHPIPENDAWWGKGFTEWTNVSKAAPQFVGHYQPRLPDELGYYDLRVPDVQRRQVEIAKHYGVHGFCFHYYWFTGRKRLLERPLNQFVGSDIDFPFCICWANENWTRRWDGMDSEILMEQRHQPEDDLQFIEDLAPLLCDPRYIRVDGKPLVIVYRVDIIPHPHRMVQVWRDFCRAHGIGEILLVAAQTFGTTDPRKFGFDAAVEFPPHKINTAEVTRSQNLLNAGFQGKVFSYPNVAKNESRVVWPDYKLFKTVMPAWDNEARKPGKGHAFTGSTPAIYKSWFDSICKATDEHARTADEKIVFINAWNEWAEGAYLEPDRRFGFAYLQATRETLAAFPAQGKPRAAPQRVATTLPRPPLHVVAHAFYPDVFEELVGHLRDAPVPFRLTATTPPERAADVRAAFERSGAKAEFQLVEAPNRGRDVFAFFEALKRADIPPEAVILKVHTKATNHRIDGEDWRREMADRLMAPHVIARVLDAFAEDDKLGLVAPGRYIAPLRTYIGENQPHIDALLRRGGWKPIAPDDVFAAGTMFFVRRRNLQSLIDLDLPMSVYAEEAGQKDGTVAHAMERLFAMIVLREGYKISDTEALLNGWDWSVNSDFAYAVKTDYLFKPS